MAFSRDGLSKIASSAGDAPSLWSYTTTDTVATVNTADYFLSATNELNQGDAILIYSSTGGTPVMTLTYFNSVTSSTVDIVDGNVISATDTD